MSLRLDPGRRATLLLVLPLLAATVAGCLGGDPGSQGPSVDVSSYEEAREAPGLVLDPLESSPGVEVKLLAPASSSVDSPGTQPVVLLVHDPGAGEPIEDAEVGLEARMPAMDHGTGPESDPVHVGSGVYEGQTTWSMAGEWVLHLDVELPDGSSASYAPEITVGEHEDDGSTEPVEPYGSFGEVMAAPGTVYEGELVSPAKDNLTVRDEVQEPTYERRESLQTGDRALASLEIRAAMEPGTRLDELNVSLLDPAGDPVASLLLTAGEPTGQAVLEDASAGEWQIDVTGQGLGASYEVVLEAVYEAPHVDVKTLEPSDPTRAIGGERPFLFAVFDALEPAPVGDAQVDVAFQPPGGQDLTEQTPVHEGHGQYRATSDFETGEEWRVGIDVRLPTGEAYRYEIDVRVGSP